MITDEMVEKAWFVLGDQPRHVRDRMRAALEAIEPMLFYDYQQLANKLGDAYEQKCNEVLKARAQGMKEATIAWTVCASIHREYAKGRDPFFTTRQADFVKAENDARARAQELDPK